MLENSTISGMPKASRPLCLVMGDFIVIKASPRTYGACVIDIKMKIGVAVCNFKLEINEAM